MPRDDVPLRHGDAGARSETDSPSGTMSSATSTGSGRDGAPATTAVHGAGGGHRGRRSHGDLTTGSVRKHVWRLGWPQVTEQGLIAFDHFVDLIWAGRLPGGFRAVAGLGVGQAFSQLSIMARQGLDQAMRAMVSRAVGAGDIRLANHIVLQAFTLNLVYGLVMMLVGLFLTDTLLDLVGVSPEVHAQTAMYLRIQFVSAVTVAFRTMTGAALQAAGDVMTPLKASTVTRVVQLTASPVLMFGWLGLPEFGLAGAAIARVLAQLAGGCVNSYALFHGSSRLHLTFRGYRLDYAILGRMLKISAPASIAGTERGLAQVALLWLVTPFGDVVTAAYALTRRLETLFQLGAGGMGQASGTMVGQNLGAQQPERARSSVKWGLVYVTLVQAAVGSLLFVFPELVIRLFTSEPEVVELGAVWFRLQVAAAVIMALAQVFQESYNTAGDTLAPMVVTFVALWLVEIPIAWLLANHTGLGAPGIAVAAIVGMSSRLVFYVPYFFTQRWLRIRVIG